MSIKALYVHVPFCHHICAYCDFMRVGYHPDLVKSYLSALAIEKVQYDFKDVDTVYFGGGTPSALSLSELIELFTLFETEIKQATEVTFEVNPESLDEAKAQLLVQYGVNRVSLGVQSFHSSELIAMDRKHDQKDVYRSIELLKSVGIDNISIDLMYGLPNQTIESLNESLEAMFKLNLKHFSIYALTIEAHSKWGREGKKAVDEELEGLMYEHILKKAKAQGYQHYEVSSFTKKAHSAHNLHYWGYDDYCGLGPGAASKMGLKRYDNTRNLQAYFKDPLLKEITVLKPTENLFEHIMMGLRMEEGIDLNKLSLKVGMDVYVLYETVIKKQLNLGHLSFENSVLKTTERGRAILHDVLIEFMLD